MINIDKIFEQCVEVDPFNGECYELLEKVMDVTSPMKFDDEFASDEDLDRLLAELDRFNRRSTEGDTLRRTIENLNPYRSNGFVFI